MAMGLAPSTPQAPQICLYDFSLFYFLSAFSTHIHAHVRTLKLTHTLTHVHSHTHSHTYTQTKLVLHVKASLSCVMVNRRQIKIYVWICSGHFFFFFNKFVGLQ